MWGAYLALNRSRWLPTICSIPEVAFPAAACSPDSSSPDCSTLPSKSFVLQTGRRILILGINVVNLLEFQDKILSVTQKWYTAKVRAGCTGILGQDRQQ